MDEFVEHHIVGYIRGHLHEPPVERNGSARRAGPPARLLITNLDVDGTQAVRHPEGDAARGQLRHSLGAPALMEGRSQADAAGGRQRQDGRTTTNRAAIADDGVPFAAVPGVRAAGPLGPRAAPRPLGRNPVPVPRRERQSTVHRRSARHRDPDDASRRQSENVAACEPVPHDLDRKDTSSGFDDPPARGRGGPRQTQLHSASYTAEQSDASCRPMHQSAHTRTQVQASSYLHALPDSH